MTGGGKSELPSIALSAALLKKWTPRTRQPRFIIRQARSVPAYARQMGWVIGDPAAGIRRKFVGHPALVDRAMAV